ncbi:MAG: hypothetical protein FWC65_00385 [Treponema sp.]|nr:hypothetical protein [Treponema sp.]
METNASARDGSPMTDPSGVVFDSASGISLEEQQEILDGINAMTGTGRLVSDAPVTAAKKRGIMFPVLVNSAAVVILAAGFFLLSHFHVQEEQSIRESSATLGLTERALIQEIRLQNSRQMREKEAEINAVLMMLSSADAEYRFLSESVEVLTEAQRERAAELARMQDEFRSTLSGLYEERARIVEFSRQAEMSLRTDADERERALAAQLEQREFHLTAAMEELRHISAEQERAARAESQMSAYYALADSHIDAGRLDEASSTLITMREFLDAPSLRGIRAVEERRPAHLAAIGALEGAVAEARRLAQAMALMGAAAPVAGHQDGSIAAELEDIRARYAALERQLNAQGQIIAGGDAEQAQIIAGFENSIAALRTENEQLGAASRSQQETLNQRANEVQALTNQVQASQAMLETQRGQNAALTQQNTDLLNRYTDLQNRLEDAQRMLQAAMGLF